MEYPQVQVKVKVEVEVEDKERLFSASTCERE
jgi:hypothetical protein